ncbi:MAG: hypothetical protein L0Y54_03605 [Sporichthyaceae bacterium]|nr:hypothetical protein [Sporichthyaceae bacterium]
MAHLRAVLDTDPRAAALLAYRDVVVSRIRRGADRGDMPMGWVLVVALTIGIVLAVGGILMTKLQTKANGLDLTTP